MSDIEKMIVSEEDFKKYFDSKNVISREEYLNYLKGKGLK